MGSNAETGIESPDGAANPIETDYEIGQDNITTQIGPFGLDVHNPVFLISGLSIVAFVFLTLAFQDSGGPMFNTAILTCRSFLQCANIVSTSDLSSSPPKC